LLKDKFRIPEHCQGSVDDQNKTFLCWPWQHSFLLCW